MKRRGTVMMMCEMCMGMMSMCMFLRAQNDRLLSKNCLVGLKKPVCEQSSGRSIDLPLFFCLFRWAAGHVHSPAARRQQDHTIPSKHI